MGKSKKAQDETKFAVDLKAVLAMEPEERAKWLSMACRFVDDGAVSANQLYDVLASDRITTKLSRQSGWKMCKTLLKNMELFSDKQQKTLRQSALLSQFGHEARDGAIQAAKIKSDKSAAGPSDLVEDMMARCRTFVRESAGSYEDRERAVKLQEEWAQIAAWHEPLEEWEKACMTRNDVMLLDKAARAEEERLQAILEWQLQSEKAQAEEERTRKEEERKRAEEEERLKAERMKARKAWLAQELQKREEAEDRERAAERRKKERAEAEQRRREEREAEEKRRRTEQMRRRLAAEFKAEEERKRLEKELEQRKRKEEETRQAELEREARAAEERKHAMEAHRILEEATLRAASMSNKRNADRILEEARTRAETVNKKQKLDAAPAASTAGNQTAVGKQIVFRMPGALEFQFRKSEEDSHQPASGGEAPLPLTAQTDSNTGPLGDTRDDAVATEPHLAPEANEQTAPAVAKQQFGWMLGRTPCSCCSKQVVDRGGVVCGRRRPSGEVVGCGAGICWKCMNKAKKDDFGSVKTTKAEFESLGDEAWWMHEACMQPEDETDFFGNDEASASEEETAAKSKDDEEEEGKFAWE